MTLRETLKAATRPDHDRVDALYGSLNLIEVAGLRHFLHGHLLALLAIEAVVRQRRPDSDFPIGLSDLAQADLRVLGTVVPDIAPHAAPRIGVYEGLTTAHPDGLIYVVAGAHLGAGVLRKQWARATDPRVRRAGSYLGAVAMRDYWPIIVSRLAAATPESDEGQDIIAAAKTGFRVFEEAFGRAGQAVSEDGNG